MNDLGQILWAAICGLIAWTGDRLHRKVDKLDASIVKMMVQNSADHATVCAQIEALTLELERMKRAPSTHAAGSDT